jgi:hypothetical protein
LLEFARLLGRIIAARGTRHAARGGHSVPGVGWVLRDGPRSQRPPGPAPSLRCRGAGGGSRRLQGRFRAASGARAGSRPGGPAGRLIGWADSPLANRRNNHAPFWSLGAPASHADRRGELPEPALLPAH